MKEKIRTALRIAIWYGYERLCIGTFGLGPGFRNPVEEVALMWRDVLLHESEFKGHFQDIVFAFEAPEGPESLVSTNSKAQSKAQSKPGSKTSTKSSASAKSTVSADLEVFKFVFKPANVHDAFKHPDVREYAASEQVC